MLRSGLSAFLRNLRNRKAFKVPSETRHISRASAKILGGLAGLRLDEGSAFDIRLCVEEAVRNAIVHGNHSDRRRAVRVAYWVDGPDIFIEIEDEGAGYDHNALADPTGSGRITANCGRGVYLIKKLMDKVVFNDKGNRITMMKRLA
jgi:serine/threonine-protein kinase RsbW